MAMGNWRAERQPPLWVATKAKELAVPPAHPFYQKVNEVLRNHGFDRFVEGLCQKFYAPKMGRPSIPPARGPRDAPAGVHLGSGGSGKGGRAEGEDPGR